MKRSSIFILFCVLGLVVADVTYFKSIRLKSEFSVNEAFLNKGILGKILKENALIKISPETEHLATNDICAKDVDFKGYDYHNTYRLRFKIHSERVEKIRVEILFPESKRYRLTLKDLDITPGREYYTVKFVAFKGLDFNIKLAKKTQNPIVVESIYVDGRFGRTQTLFDKGNELIGGFERSEAVQAQQSQAKAKGFEFSAQQKEIRYLVKGGLHDSLYSGVFPGKKNSGFCRYVAFDPDKDIAVTQTIVPTVNLNVEEKYLYGEQGIVDNKTGKGRSWEVPAEYYVQNKQLGSHQYLGLRFHGGTPGRKKNIESFRINARQDYGKPTIDIEPLMGRKRERDLKGVVFKYTYQAYDLERTQYNPYNHALALDIANAVGALVPAHALVDLNINNESQGLFLAMEHLSKRTISYWLDQEKFKTFTYKKYNDEHQKFALLYPIGQIIKAKGESAYELFTESYDVNNVLNSVILSAYISDDDYCQGIEVIQQAGDDQKHRITSINWDLDHAFLFFKNGKYSMPVKREDGRDGLDILKENKTHAQSLCPRKWVYSHVYTQSKQFRTLVHDRMKSAMENELSPKNVKKMINQYRLIDQEYHQGKHQEAINQMLDYADKRPAVLLDALKQFEQEVENNLALVQ